MALAMMTVLVMMLALAMMTVLVMMLALAMMTVLALAACAQMLARVLMPVLQPLSPLLADARWRVSPQADLLHVARLPVQMPAKAPLALLLTQLREEAESPLPAAVAGPW